MNTQMTKLPAGSDRFRPELPSDDNYDHDLDDPEFYHYSEETEDDEWEEYMEEEFDDNGGGPPWSD